MHPVSTAAAAAAARRRREEEEEMAQYTREDLAGDWEFKMLRSMTSAFKNPETLKRVLEDEARSGWVLVEKFDNGRIRLKRLRGAASADQMQGADPYRTYVGLSEVQFALLIVAITLGSMIGVALLIAAISALK